jgi:hypothetical protein
LTTSGKSTTLTTAPRASSSSLDVVSPDRSFIREALNVTLATRSPLVSYSGCSGGSMMYSARWVRISIDSSTAKRITLRNDSWICFCRCDGGGRSVESVL